MKVLVIPKNNNNELAKFFYYAKMCECKGAHDKHYVTKANI